MGVDDQDLGPRPQFQVHRLAGQGSYVHLLALGAVLHIDLVSGEVAAVVLPQIGVLHHLAVLDRGELRLLLVVLLLVDGLGGRLLRLRLLCQKGVHRRAAAGDQGGLGQQQPAPSVQVGREPVPRWGPLQFLTQRAQNEGGGLSQPPQGVPGPGQICRQSKDPQCRQRQPQGRSPAQSAQSALPPLTAHAITPFVSKPEASYAQTGRFMTGLSFCSAEKLCPPPMEADTAYFILSNWRAGRRSGER